MMQCVREGKEWVVSSFLGALSVFVSILLFCKKECGVYSECETRVILRYHALVVAPKGNAKHIDHFGSSWF